MFHGSMVALVTPMDEQGLIDYSALTRLVDFHLEQGTDALVIAGTTGESATLTATEHQHLLRHVVEQVGARIPVIAGTGCTATQKTIELTAEAMRIGADACLLMAPAYVKPTQEGLYQHYKAVANAVAIPQILYNVPGRTASDILPETAARLAEFSNIIGIKEASGDLGRVTAILELCGDSLDVYSGEDGLTKDMLLAGGKGVISVTANVAPKAMHELCVAGLEGDATTAESINNHLQALHQVLFIESNPIPVKWALHEMGFISSGIRLPLTPLAPEKRAELRQVLQSTGIL